MCSCVLNSEHARYMFRVLAAFCTAEKAAKFHSALPHCISGLISMLLLSGIAFNLAKIYEYIPDLITLRSNINLNCDNYLSFSGANIF